ncbi:host specificity factor TipJ family phage tail protein [Siccibacter turicensis]|uniref:host specificity factor TipJ family phage tail protein n=1 Tax=Siccibacter turicensis TaxID=357233 RepID=UPI003F57159C
MPVIELQRVPGTPKERHTVPQGMLLSEWLLSADIHEDVVVVLNGREMRPDDEMAISLLESDRVQVFDQPKSVIGDVLSPVFKLVSKVFSFLAPQPALSSADTNAKESPNNKLTGQTNIARTYQARPDVYGQVRSYPDLIAPSLFEFSGNVKYVTEWMNFGIGKYSVTNVRYSESSLGTLAGASYEIFQPGQVIPTMMEGFEFDDVDGQELPGPNQSGSVPVVSASATNVVSGTYSGGQVAMKIRKQTSFDYFLNIAKPRGVTFVINVTYNTASGPVTKDITLSADLFNATESNDGAVTNPTYFYNFFFRSLSGADASSTPANATVNTAKFILNDNQTVTMGPFFSPVEGDQLWFHFQAQQADGVTASYSVTLWKVDDNNVQIPGTTQSFNGSVSNNSGGSDFRYSTVKFAPSAGLGRYAIQVRRTDNWSDYNILQLSEIHSVRVRQNVVHAEDTLVRVTVRATEQATGIRERKYNALITRHTISYNLSSGTVDYGLRPSRSFADAVAHTWLVIGKQPVSSIDLYGLYQIAASIPDARLAQFDYTFDDEDISLGNRVETICNAARVIAYWEDGVLCFVRDQKEAYPATIFNRNNTLAEEYKLTWEMTLPGGFDGVEVEYVSPVTNKKTYIRYRVTSGGIVEQAAQNPNKITLHGCRDEYQARDRALLEARKLIYSRGRMTCKTLADGQYVSVGDMIQVPDTYDTNQQSGYIVRRSGNNFDTSEAITFTGTMYVTVTDNLGTPTARYLAKERSDTRFGFTAAIPNIPLNIWDGYEVQSPSRYVIATEEEHDATLWRVEEKKPNADSTTSFTLTEYSDLIYQ